MTAGQATGEIGGLTEGLNRGRGSTFSARSRDVRPDRSARDLADSVLALTQGAFVVGLSSREERALRSVGATLAEVVSIR